MSSQLLNGKTIARRINEQTRQALAELDFVPGLGVILVGNDPASQLYVGLKEKACRRLGIEFIRRDLPADATQAEVLTALRGLNEGTAIHGIIVQLPLPPHLATDEIIAAIDPRKDADGFHPANAERDDVPPVLPQAVLELLRETEQDLTDQTAVVLANSEIFFNQLERTLKTADINSVLTAPHDLTAIKEADILIVALGNPSLIRGEHIKDGAIVIDIGTTRVDNRTVGDVDSASVQDIAGWLTPVPGGVGPVTVALLLQNVVRLAKKNQPH